MFNNKDVWKYAGMASQIMATLGVAFFLGYKIDKWVGWKVPILMLLLPLIALLVLFWKIYKESSSKHEK